MKFSSISKNKIYHTGFYLRLSRDDGDRDESESIAHQQAFLEHYIEQKGGEFLLCDVYKDDGFTGTNFNRPDFERMIADIESKNINCVIVKDLSRFGRDYIDVGRYLEKYFPQMGIRFIAVNDNIDSHMKEYDMLMPIKNIFNEQYSRDISKKVSTAYNTLQQKGCFIGSYSSYGYKKASYDKHKLIIDDYPASIVRRIFDMFIKGCSRRQIAMILNEEKIPSPSAYKKSLHPNYTNGRTLNDKYAWSYNTVYDILRKEVYIGHMVQHIHQVESIRGKCKKTQPEDYIRVKHTHEPIIDLETWSTVQKMIKNVSYQADTTNKPVSPFAGFVRCGDCGKAMNRYYGYVKKDVGRVYYYACASYKRYGKSVCTKHVIRFDLLEQVLLDDLNAHLTKIRSLKEIVYQKAAELSTSGKANNVEAEIAKAKIDIRKIEARKKELYGDYKDDLISREEMLSYKDEYNRTISVLENKIETLTGMYEKEEDMFSSPYIQKLLECKCFTEITREVVVEFVEKIEVFEDKHLEIHYNFSEEVDVILQSEYIL